MHESIPLRRRRLLELLPTDLASSLTAPGSAFADTPAIVSERAPASFLRASEALTANPELDPVLADRLWSAFSAMTPEVIPSLSKLSNLAPQGVDIDVLMETAGRAGLSDVAGALIAASYTGTVGPRTKVEIVAYDLALVYGTVADGLMPSTYVRPGQAVAKLRAHLAVGGDLRGIVVGPAGDEDNRPGG